MSAFIEYTIYNELSIGMSVDIGGFFVLVLSAKAADEQKKRDKPYENEFAAHNVNIFHSRGKRIEKSNDKAK